MKQHEADKLAERRARAVRISGIWMWVFFFPVLGGVLCLVFYAGYHAPAHRPPPPAFSCASERADLSVLGAGGSIAPLCGETPYPDAPAPDGG